MKKERIYVFRHWRTTKAMTGCFTREELEAQLLEDCLSRGYIPLWPFFFESVCMVDRADTVCAYAGKRVAREIWTKEKDSLNRKNWDKTHQI